MNHAHLTLSLNEMEKKALEFKELLKKYFPKKTIDIILARNESFYVICYVTLFEAIVIQISSDYLQIYIKKIYIVADKIDTTRIYHADIGNVDLDFVRKLIKRYDNLG